MTSKSDDFLRGIIYLNIFVCHSVRGQLNSYLQISCYSGMTFAYVLGSYLHYHTVPLVLLAFPIIFFVMFVWLHDSPQQLLKQGNEEVIRINTYI